MSCICFEGLLKARFQETSKKNTFILNVFRKSSHNDCHLKEFYRFQFMVINVQKKFQRFLQFALH